MIVSFDPEQRTFCLDNYSQTLVFAKHLFAVLLLQSTPAADLISGHINCTAVDSVLLRLECFEWPNYEGNK